MQAICFVSTFSFLPTPQMHNSAALSTAGAVTLMYTPCIPDAQAQRPAILSKSDHFFYFPSTQAWLRKFGYLSQASRQMSTMQSAQIMSKAISDMQRLYGLEVTGKVDSATLA